MHAANHPPSCRKCAGTGWERGPDIEQTAPDGRVLRRYSSVTPCTHHWSNDENIHDELIKRDEYVARLAPDDPQREMWNGLGKRWSQAL